MEEIKRVLTREELHELVWSTPMQQLAQLYGISDRGLAKTCERHLVPVPPRGFWAKLEAGQPVKKTALRAVENNALHTVRIGFAQQRLSEGAFKAVVAAKAEKAKQASQRSKHSRPAKAEPLTILEPGENPHKSIASLVKQLRKAKPDGDGVIHAPGIAVHHQSRERSVTIMHNLARVCEGKGARLSIEGDTLRLRCELGSAIISLNEERRRIKHEPTPDEQAEYQRLKTKRDKERARNIWSFFGRIEPWPEFDIIYTGKLTLAYEGWTQGIRKSWSDGKSQTVEGSLADFVDGVSLIFAAKAEDARIAAEKDRRRNALRHRRELAEKRAKREEQRLAYLQSVAGIRREVADLRATIDAVPKADHLPPEYRRMIEWAEGRVRELEARTTVEQIQLILISEALYPFPDDLHDPEGDPPPKTNYWDD
ncbi:hypothetical protein GFM14_02920 [Rhizobium leguminosarum bv. viciae]|uniref:hypothetical protein n=1 Tax=Rhizobium leguminosarum TaxID=384 RepID=UPI0014416FF3|nr:hypothetical protein [Rhizobium leguminosarum]NKJ90568.1 hypothetical protein [Rhizobium leguminosarum bv. viciae]